MHGKGKLWSRTGRFGRQILDLSERGEKKNYFQELGWGHSSLRSGRRIIGICLVVGDLSLAMWR